MIVRPEIQRAIGSATCDAHPGTATPWAEPTGMMVTATRVWAIRGGLGREPQRGLPRAEPQSGCGAEPREENFGVLGAENGQGNGKNIITTDTKLGR